MKKIKRKRVIRVKCFFFCVGFCEKDMELLQRDLPCVLDDVFWLKFFSNFVLLVHSDGLEFDNK